MLQEEGLYFVVEMCGNSLLLVVVGLLLSLLWPTWREGLDKGRTNAAFLSVRNMKLPRSRMSGRDILNNLRSIHVQEQNGTEKKISVHEKSLLFFFSSAQEKMSEHVTFCCLKNDEEKIKTVTLSLYQGHILEISQNLMVNSIMEE